MKKYFEWDSVIWGEALKVWHSALDGKVYKTALDIGARRGGMSLFLAEQYNLSIVCSDLNNPEIIARELHEKFDVSNKIIYQSVDCLNIPYSDSTFDVIIFKSVLGDLGTYENQEKAIKEMYRVLKKGGVLLFAENLEASWLHMFFRKKFISWASYWRYVKLNDMNKWLKIFDNSKIETNGFWTTFTPYKMREFVGVFDSFICLMIPPKYKYVCFGYAIK